MEEEGGLPTQQRAQTVCSQEEEEEGDPHELQRMHFSRAQGREGVTPTRQSATLARSQGEGEAENPPDPQHAHLAHDMQ